MICYEFLAVSIGVFLCLVIWPRCEPDQGDLVDDFLPGGDFFRVFRVHFLTISEFPREKTRQPLWLTLSTTV